MNDNKIILKNLISEILIEKGGEAIVELKLTDNLRDNYGMDSFDLALLTVKIENIYDIDIFCDGIVYTVSDILNKIDK
jgi:acyl carrier protein